MMHSTRAVIFVLLWLSGGDATHSNDQDTKVLMQSNDIAPDFRRARPTAGRLLLGGARGEGGGGQSGDRAAEIAGDATTAEAPSPRPVSECISCGDDEDDWWTEDEVNYHAALLPGVPPPITVSKVSLKKFRGRLGNNLLQLANAILFCQIMNLSHLVLPPNSTNRVPMLTLPSEIPIKPDPSAKFEYNMRQCVDFFGLCIVAKKWQMRAALMQHLPDYFSEQTRNACQKELARPFPGLTIHLRSGDVSTSQHSTSRKRHYATTKYGVFAPCAFFLKVIDDHKFHSVRIITEPDRSHECIRVLQESRREERIRFLTIQSNSLEEDTCALMNAKHLAVGSFSTFTQALELMNGVLKAFYWPLPLPIGQENSPCDAVQDDGAITYRYAVVGMTNVNEVPDPARYFDTFPMENVTLRDTCAEGQELPFRGARYGKAKSIADRFHSAARKHTTGTG